MELEACGIARVDFEKEKIDNINNLLGSASQILREMQLKPQINSQMDASTCLSEWLR